MEPRLAVKAFIVKEGNLLLVKRSDDEVHQPGIWEPPGGRLTLGEDPIRGLKREVLEETGLEIEVLHPFNVRHFVREDGQTVTLMIFLAKASEGEVTISSEHSAFEWVGLENCKEKIANWFHPEVDLFNKLELRKQL